MLPDFDAASLPLMTALQTAALRSSAGFHTPGHQRGQGALPQWVEVVGDRALTADLPELPELDNLFAPRGVIQQAQALAAQTFGAEQTWFLANGSTSGILAGILATCNPNEKIILPRNVHQSAIAGLVLAGAIPIFVNPDYDPVLDIAHCVTPAAIAHALTAHPDARAVLIVSPTYYGACGDVAAIAHLCHHHGVPLLVDEAHGAHFAFHPDLPASALESGADLAVQSTHKVLSALTQAAMLHTQGELIDRDRLTQSLTLVQSTSPSYLLLASLDAARYQMATAGTALMQRTLQLADQARSRLSQIPLPVLGPTQAQTPGFIALDRTRLTVSVSGLGITGFTADELLNQQFGVVAELPALRHLTFILTLGNTQADLDRLLEAFTQLPTLSSLSALPPPLSPSALPPPPSACLPPRAAFFAPSSTVAIAAAENQISAELICPYPPGIPVLLPGEIITAEAIAYLQAVLSAGGIVSGCADLSLETVRVVQG